MPVFSPDNEASRLEALKDIEILDTPAERQLDDLTRLAAMICQTPMALISLVDDHRQWFKSKIGLDACETDRDIAFCARAIQENEIFIVPDARRDARFKNNPLVTGAPHIRFYAGAPLVTDDGYALGTLCVLDQRPRRLNAKQKEALAALARQVVAQMTLRRQTASIAGANALLKQSEENYRIVAETASDVIITVDESAAILFVNPAAKKVLGYEPQELIGKNLAIIIPERFRAAHTAGMNRYMQTNKRGIPWSGVELPAVRCDGREIQVEISFGESREKDRRIFTAVIRDITDRKNTEAELRRSEEYRNLFRLANDAILIFDPADETILDANERACEIYGFCREEFLGKSIKAISQSGARGEQALTELLRQGSYEEFETVQYHADGTPIHFLINSTVIEFQGKQAVLSINRDITGRKQIENEHKIAATRLAESEQRFRSFMNNNPAVGFMKNEDGRFVYVNETMHRIFDLEKGSLLGKSDFDWLPEDVARQIRANDARILTSEEAVEVEEMMPTPDGKPCFWMVYKFPFKDATGKRFIGGVAVDITARKHAEESLQRNFSLLTSTLEATADGILAVDTNDRIISINKRFADMWEMSEQMVRNLDSAETPQHVLNQIKNPENHLKNLKRINLNQNRDTYDVFELVNGKIYERYSKPQKLDGKVIGQVFSFRDVTERKRAEEQLIHNALHDQLTGLPNRALFLEHLRHAIERNGERSKKSFAVLFLDFDHFKVINDSLGHMEGDKLLRLIAQRLENSLRPGDIVARLGGDEFTILLDDLGAIADVEPIVERIHHDLKTPFDLTEREVSISASIGIALSGNNYSKPEEMVRDADIAMYRAKANGKARHQIFDNAMHEQANSRLQMEIEMRRAVEREEFRAYYQPIVDLRNDRIVGFESLVRWSHPEKGVVSPAEFIPLAEETGLIVPLGLWVMRESCRQLREWQIENMFEHELTMSVNLSCVQFLQNDLVEQIVAILDETKIEARLLRLEITESHVMRDSETAITIMNRLRALGVKLSIDDFGTGYSSLSYLHRLPVNYLKIDRSFVSRLQSNSESGEIVRTIIMLAKNLHIEVIAEGIETAEQFEYLKTLDCRYGQGYLFSKPVEAELARSLLADRASASVFAASANNMNVELINDAEH